MLVSLSTKLTSQSGVEGRRIISVIILLSKFEIEFHFPQSCLGRNIGPKEITINKAKSFYKSSKTMNCEYYLYNLYIALHYIDFLES